MNSEQDRESRELAQRMQRVEALTQQLEHCADSSARAASQELVAVLLDMHGAGLTKMLALLSDAGAGEVLSAFAADSLVANLLLLHGLHPDSLEVRVRRALEQAGPVLASDHAEAELVALDEGVVRLRLHGSNNSMLTRAATLRQTLQEAILEAAPDVLGVEIEGLPAVDTGGRLFALPLVGDPQPPS